MADARFPDRWLSDRRIQRLSDSHFRAFITSLAWSVSNRTDGVIEPEDLGLIPNFAANAVQAFIDAGLWLPLQHGWQIADFMATQTSREQLAAAELGRQRERDKKARQRAAKNGAASCTDADVPPDVPGDVPGDNTGKARQGQDRPGRSKGNSQLKLAAGSEWRGAGPDPFDEYK
jgi:hypothetical protein